MKTFWVEKPEQIRALSSPLRHEIGDRLAAQGPLTVRELAAALGMKATAVYHHLKALEGAGLVVRAGERREGGRPAVAYGTPAPLMRMARAARRKSNRPALAQAGIAAATQAGRDYANGFAPEHWAIDGSGRNHWFFRIVTAPSKPRLARINKLLDELATLIWTPDPNPGPPMSVAWFLAPLAERKDDE
jgi:DNA-binding transcriptional ArsR family regulator